MNILIINWRSIKDPLAGGADAATFQHAKKWVENHSANVYWLAPKYNREIASETISGIKFVYLGSPLSGNPLRLSWRFLRFCLSACWHYLFNFRKKIDVVIDQIHGLPYLTPLYVTKKIVANIHEVGGNIWNLHFPFPINVIGRNLEGILLRLFYKKIVFVTVSPSTKKDLIRLGLSEKNINIVINGVSIPPAEQLLKAENFTVLFLNRLVKVKGVERALKVFSLLKIKLPTARMWVAGRCQKEYKQGLKRLCQELDIGNAVTFFDYVNEEKKINLFSKAHVFLNTSYKEGWGLVNLEANRRGTPAVAFDVEGNRDSIKNNVSGFLVKDDDLQAMAEAVLMVKKKGSNLRESALAYSKLFSWEKASDEFYKILS